MILKRFLGGFLVVVTVLAGINCFGFDTYPYEAAESDLENTLSIEEQMLAAENTGEAEYAEETENADAAEYYAETENAEDSNFSSGSAAVAPPSFGVVCAFGGRKVTFLSKTYDAKIYYTTENRSTLTTSDPCVKNGSTVLFNKYYGTMYARAYYKGKWSVPARLILKIPTVNTPSAWRTDSTHIKLSTTTPGAYLYYTTDGTTPSMNNYAGRLWCSRIIRMGKGKVIKVIGVRSGFTDSQITTFYS